MPRLFGDKLRLLRTRHNETQVQLAQHLLPLNQPHVANLESGRTTPSLDLIIRAARHFEVSLDYLLRDAVAVEAIIPAPPLPTDHTPPQPFGAKLRLLRERRTWRQVNLAHQLGLARPGYISNLELGRKQPSPELAVQIADLFGVGLDALLREEVPLPQETGS